MAKPLLFSLLLFAVVTFVRTISEASEETEKQAISDLQSNGKLLPSQLSLVPFNSTIFDFTKDDWSVKNAINSDVEQINIETMITQVPKKVTLRTYIRAGINVTLRFKIFIERGHQTALNIKLASKSHSKVWSSESAMTNGNSFAVSLKIRNVEESQLKIDGYLSGPDDKIAVSNFTLELHNSNLNSVINKMSPVSIVNVLNNSPQTPDFSSKSDASKSGDDMNIFTSNVNTIKPIFDISVAWDDRPESPINVSESSINVSESSINVSESAIGNESRGNSIVKSSFLDRLSPNLPIIVIVIFVFAVMIVIIVVSVIWLRKTKKKDEEVQFFSRIHDQRPFYCIRETDFDYGLNPIFANKFKTAE